ncbi:SDR family NAD(P)-dependent oxidoreductase [Pseudofrankia inefficax]|uniref:Short-chain dehydrogenase/reductase SDR n=1 Tax=Pseudofrankia inefficax (strain DSM 45817 / CECT 9037 / DDB 130130 / EuI1c) TaxID=298654 RepID=E3J1K4_PSEI1|nr:SDR family NAD(P)-dependent oxidoreductase [Pseudofrankia inefficax]ADP81672.1 short-chain dehydrogenase/reductase SDR [Pseudofrankia inefficax]
MARQQERTGQLVDETPWPVHEEQLPALVPAPRIPPGPVVGDAGNDQPLAGRTVVVTGASAGIGAAAVRQLAALGARIIALGRSPLKTAAVAAETGATPVVADFARLSDVRHAAAEVAALCPRIDVLVNNAGGLFPHRVVTEDGNELTFQVNHLAPFLLTSLLLPRLRETPGSRVIVTSSFMNLEGRIDLTGLETDPGCADRRYRPFVAYSTSKLANILFVKELARRGYPDGPTATAVHPGVVLSSFGRDSWFVRTFYRRPLKVFGARSSDSGAMPLVDLATRPNPQALNGTFRMRFHQGERLFTARQANDPGLARELWDYSLERVGLPG